MRNVCVGFQGHVCGVGFAEADDDHLTGSSLGLKFRPGNAEGIPLGDLCGIFSGALVQRVRLAENKQAASRQIIQQRAERGCSELKI